MRIANIADLRDHLTQYLREVRAGREILVRDRQRPIAKIVPFAVNDEEDAALVAGGLMRRAERPLPRSFWTSRRSGVPVRTAVDAVTRDREAR